MDPDLIEDLWLDTRFRLPAPRTLVRKIEDAASKDRTLRSALDLFLLTLGQNDRELLALGVQVHYLDALDHVYSHHVNEEC